MVCPENTTAKLEKGFNDIYKDRMQGLPILNPKLSVQAVDFRLWNEHCIGVLITPWFMNLMMLPKDREYLKQNNPGSKLDFTFPSGTYEFIIGEEQLVGKYMSCSLFSPVFEFADQQAAVATAKAIMLGLMDENNQDTTSMREKEIQRIWQGEPDETEEEGDNNLHSKTAPPSLEERLQEPLTRRELLRGHFLRDSDER